MDIATLPNLIFDRIIFYLQNEAYKLRVSQKLHKKLYVIFMQTAKNKIFSHTKIFVMLIRTDMPAEVLDLVRENEDYLLKSCVGTFQLLNILFNYNHRIEFINKILILAPAGKSHALTGLVDKILILYDRSTILQIRENLSESQQYYSSFVLKMFPQLKITNAEVWYDIIDNIVSSYHEYDYVDNVQNFILWERIKQFPVSAAMHIVKNTNAILYDKKVDKNLILKILKILN